MLKWVVNFLVVVFFMSVLGDGFVSAESSFFDADDFFIMYDVTSSATSDSGGAGGGDFDNFYGGAMIGGGGGGGVFRLSPSGVNYWFFKFPYLSDDGRRFVFFANRGVESCDFVNVSGSGFGCDFDNLSRVRVFFDGGRNVFNDEVGGFLRVVSVDGDVVLLPLSVKLVNFGWFYENDFFVSEVPFITKVDGGVVKGVYIFTSLVVFGVVFFVLKGVVL